ncbi:MAG: TIGR03013 family PEP-CTERM/XrtA system glycosyltransferase [Magnetococcus sp. WYHC-3]
MIRIFRHYISRWSLLLVIMEMVCFLLAVYAGVWLRFISLPEPDEVHADVLLPRALFFMLVMTVSMTATGRYQRLMEDGLAGEALRVALSFVIGLVAMSMLFYVFPDLLLGRGAFAYALGVALGGVIFSRWLFIRFLLDWEVLKRRILVLGVGPLAEEVRQATMLGDGTLVLLGFRPFPWEGEQPAAVPPESIVLDSGALWDVVRERNVHEVVIAADGMDNLPEGVMREILDCKSGGVQVLEFPVFFERELRQIHVSRMDPYWWICHSDGLEQGTLREVTKKGFDIIVALLLLLATWPIMLLAALAIWLESGGRGPILYRQQRVGFGGKRFFVLKFRSMHVDAEKDGPRWASHDDDRITRVGQVLRLTRMDELPQWFNVLKGEMSLVGPRPERPEFVEQLERRIPFFRERLRVKPGITGWAQICYGYGNSESDAARKLRYDLYYVKNHTLFFDLLVLMHSVEVVLFGRGAAPPRR